ncbi:MAG: hypothetical protein COB53_12905, partial [Elusimicrobia bacterium]
MCTPSACRSIKGFVMFYRVAAGPRFIRSVRAMSFTTRLPSASARTGSVKRFIPFMADRFPCPKPRTLSFDRRAALLAQFSGDHPQDDQQTTERPALCEHFSSQRPGEKRREDRFQRENESDFKRRRAALRCHLNIEDVVVSPYAAALGCLSDEEKALGVTCIDMGGGTTSVAVFFDGELVHIDVLPIGGAHVTSDIARGLVTPINHAERLKTLYGNAIPSTNDDRQLIQVPSVGEEETPEAHTVPRSVLVGIVRPRIEEIFEQV